jgi:murein DD-endopeptidase MepM/ murein hydrolase activator NlpD
LVITLLATLLFPAVGSTAGSNQELNEIEAKLDEVRDRIDEASSKAQSTRATLRELDKQIKILTGIVYELNAKVEKVQAEAAAIQAKIDLLQSEIDAVKAAASKQAVRLYKAGSLETLDALLKAESLTELDDRIEMMGIAARENTGALVRYGRLQVEIEAQHQALYDKKHELEGVLADREKTLAALDSAHEKNASTLARLEAELGDLHRHEGSLESAANSIEAEILKKQTLASVAVLGKSDQGFIWPLNGAINSYYGPRWGRMHTGIDIDGTTGQPVVASKSGRVIMASSYSGYGNCVIIDHGGGISTLYAHLSSFNVSSGQEISQGEIVGNVGCTGSCTGDHLHFEVRVNGSPVDPLDYLP